ncbi:MAG: hypothetical protein U0V04_12030 [Spirosomataceae bacterium]
MKNLLIKTCFFVTIILFSKNSLSQKSIVYSNGKERIIKTNILNLPKHQQWYLFLESEGKKNNNFHSFGILTTYSAKYNPLKKNKTLGIIYSHKRMFNFSNNPNLKIGPLLYSKILYRDIYRSEVEFPGQIYTFPLSEKILKSNSIVLGAGTSFNYNMKNRLIFEIKTGVGAGKNFNSKINEDAVLFPLHFDGLFLLNFGYIFKNK